MNIKTIKTSDLKKYKLLKDIIDHHSQKELMIGTIIEPYVSSFICNYILIMGAEVYNHSNFYKPLGEGRICNFEVLKDTIDYNSGKKISKGDILKPNQIVYTPKIQPLNIKNNRIMPKFHLSKNGIIKLSMIENNPDFFEEIDY